mmetsp:Transcript_33357/g.24104  ORF Transcript_33357/g.24104 Transcript_33357/m.24104 type:complete len:122 (-) Transcript_33357:969-1334(-)|eukprot:CAMPEP_0116875446 /NCGR_PEP_ID=MMETSP0463-20121206/7418_1 /TAXON_ID=181622 /ORGANISM="Strombidinopsis sp, Strain SopsisLIS2011" /LENGTH=121 /DNA_ID=CAMNT_0004521119 /DNA_START=2021 /DNA_END=2386 /DNA_ORIENTATION=-
MPVFTFPLENEATIADLKEVFKNKYPDASHIHNDKLLVVTLNRGYIKQVFSDNDQCINIDSERNDVLICELADDQNHQQPTGKDDIIVDLEFYKQVKARNKKTNVIEEVDRAVPRVQLLQK